MDLLRDLVGPGLVFLFIAFWLLRKVVKAARTESQLEDERLAGAFAEELQRGRDLARASQRPALSAVPPLSSAAAPPPARAGRETAPRGAHAPSTPGAHETPGPAHELPGAGAQESPPRAARTRASDAEGAANPGARAASQPWAPPVIRASAAQTPADSGEPPTPEQLSVVTALVAERSAALEAAGVPAHIEVLWVRATSGHVAWCERRRPASANATEARDVLCVARVENGKALQRWNFG